MANTAPANVSFPRVQPQAFTAIIFVFLIIAIAAAAARTILRVRQSRRLELDDVFLILAIVTLCAFVGVIYSVKDLLYFSVYLALGLEDPGYPLSASFDFEKAFAYYGQMDEAASLLIWTSIFAVKFSFVFFFRKLTRRVRGIEIWWRIVVAALVPCALTCMFLGFSICPQLNCSQTSLHYREGVFLNVTVGIDILTDLLVISIPIALLWNVQIDLRRKLAVGAVLCLSFFMIIIAIIRVTEAPITEGVTDSIWLFIWQSVEASTAVLMVSVTAVRAAFGHEKSGSAKRTPVHSGKTTSSVNGYNDTPTHPLAASRSYVPPGRMRERGSECSMEDLVDKRGIKVTHDILMTEQV
ncbi:hypothetical protein MMC30_002348 [Trapelia coarctata]|nr:hypothetical protein [Trapelia coarctata]